MSIEIILNENPLDLVTKELFDTFDRPCGFVESVRHYYDPNPQYVWYRKKFHRRNLRDLLMAAAPNIKNYVLGFDKCGEEKKLREYSTKFLKENVPEIVEGELNERFGNYPLVQTRKGLITRINNEKVEPSPIPVRIMDDFGIRDKYRTVTTRRILDDNKRDIGTETQLAKKGLVLPTHLAPKPSAGIIRPPLRVLAKEVEEVTNKPDDIRHKQEIAAIERIKKGEHPLTLKQRFPQYYLKPKFPIKEGKMIGSLQKSKQGTIEAKYYLKKKSLLD